MLQEGVAYLEELASALHATDVEQKRVADTFPHEIHKLLHALRLGAFRDRRVSLALPQLCHVGEQIPARRQSKRSPTAPLANLIKQPRIPDGAAANHQSARA